MTASIPNVSVVIPTYNRITMLKEALRSVLAQTFEGTIEIIVIDDNSQDGTPQTIQEQYPQIRLITCTKNGGPSAARNKGIKAAQGSYIAFLDSDDLWEPDYLKTQINALAQNNRIYFAVSDLWLWETEQNRRFHRPQGMHPDYTSLLHHLLAAGSFIHTPSAAVFPRWVFEQVGGFDQSLRFGEDTDLYIRLLLKGYRPIFTQKILVIRRKHSQGQAIEAKNLDLRIQNRLDTLKKYYPSAPHMEFSQDELSAQIYTQFATQCYRSQRFIKWMTLLKASTRHTPWWTILPRLKHDFGFTTRKIIGRLQTWRITESV
ncbi:MAG: glycosyltransferase [Symploca sp. SIO2G7]|nr:glycosyltransferase [Symploca sp. SIO2G7]